MKLEIKNISKNYNENTKYPSEILKDISIDVQENEFVAVVGPSGCGKSTLLKIIAGLLDSTSGEVTLNGKNVVSPTKNIGLVFQNCVSFPWLTVKENVEFPLIQNKIKTKEREEIVNHLINSIGLKGYENYYIQSLSGGMKQRVAIATSLASNPTVLLMDEPFSSLDTQTKGLMQELVTSIWEESRKSVLFVTHDIEEAIFLADRVYVMGAKPGIIKQQIKIDLPRPRTPEIKLSEKFLQIKKHISYLVRGEAIKSAQVDIRNIRPNALKVGIHAWPGNASFYLARELGFFEKLGLEVEIINLEKEEDRNFAFINNNIDLFVSLADQTVLLKEKIKDLKIIQILNRSDGGDGLLVNKEITSINQLKGKKIAAEKGWVSYYFLLFLLEKHGLNKNDVEIIDLKGSDIGAAIISGKVDAAVTFEPWLAQAEHLSGAKILASTKDYPIIYDVLLAKDSFIKQKKSEIQKFIKALSMATDYFKDNYDEASKIVASLLGISINEFRTQFSKLELIDNTENRNLLSESGKFKNIIKQAYDIWEHESAISEKNEYDDLIDTSFIQ